MSDDFPLNECLHHSLVSSPPSFWKDSADTLPVMGCWYGSRASWHRNACGLGRGLQKQFLAHGRNILKWVWVVPKTTCSKQVERKLTLSHVKDPEPLRSLPEVYEIPCYCWETLTNALTADENKKRKHDAEITARNCVSALNLSGSRLYLSCLQNTHHTCFVVSQSQLRVRGNYRRQKGRKL